MSKKSERSALARAEEGARDLAAGGTQDGPEDVFDLAGTAFGGALACGLLLLLLLLDLATQALGLLGGLLLREGFSFRPGGLSLGGLRCGFRCGELRLQILDVLAHGVVFRL